LAGGDDVGNEALVGGHILWVLEDRGRAGGDSPTLSIASLGRVMIVA